MTSASEGLARLPRYADIDIPKLPEQLGQLLAESREAVAALLANNSSPSWAGLMAPMAEIDERIEQFWSPVSHLFGVCNSPELREAYEQCLPQLSAYSSEMGQNCQLFEAVQALADSAEYPCLSPEQQTLIDNSLRDFRLSGVALDEDKRQRYADIKQRLSELATQFSNQVLDATKAWHWHSEDATELAGIPDFALAQYRALAEAKELPGYVISLDIPAYLPAMQHAENPALREALYRAYNSRASEIGPNAGEFDNGPVMVEILSLRRQLAELLGFAHYGELSLATKMADQPEQVLGFLNDLAAVSKPVAEAEYQALQDFAREQYGCEALQAWDVPYYAERLKEQRYSLSQEELKPYFPLDTVLEGMFALVEKLFAIRVEAEKEQTLWHPDARCYSLYSADSGEYIASFGMDLYAREDKRGGAWMSDAVGRHARLDGLQTPIAYMVCNFPPPTAELPSLLTHNDVTTLFHEFGHGLHHMLTEVDVAGISGINGVPWDAVELPSQFLENWAWEPEVVPMISGHYQTDEPLPLDLLQRLLAAKNYQSGMMMVRQLEFSLFDFELHCAEPPADAAGVQALLDNVRERVAVVPAVDCNRFQHSFSHIFAGGYAAGYYSYKWAEVLSADAYSLFEEQGVLNADTGAAFRRCVLARGGAEAPMALFTAFRGREPSNAALLRHSGIVEENEGEAA